MSTPFKHPAVEENCHLVQPLLGMHILAECREKWQLNWNETWMKYWCNVFFNYFQLQFWCVWKWCFETQTWNKATHRIARTANTPVKILHKSITGRYRPVRLADGPITARCRFIKNASWVQYRAFRGDRYILVEFPVYGLYCWNPFGSLYNWPF